MEGGCPKAPKSRCRKTQKPPSGRFREQWAMRSSEGRARRLVGGRPRDGTPLQPCYSPALLKFPAIKPTAKVLNQGRAPALMRPLKCLILILAGDPLLSAWESSVSEREVVSGYGGWVACDALVHLRP